MRIYTINMQGQEQTWALHINNSTINLDVFIVDYHIFYTKSESDFFAEVSSAVTLYKGRIKKELKSD